jgi:hypothetical protein
VEVYEWVDVTELTLTLPSEPTVSPSGPCYSSIHHHFIYEKDRHYGEYPNRPPYGDFFTNRFSMKAFHESRYCFQIVKPAKTLGF